VAKDLTITHLLFVDDILLFYDSSRNRIVDIKNALTLFQKVIGMQINALKCTISPLNLSMDESLNVQNLFPSHSYNFNDGLKYLGIHTK